MEQIPTKVWRKLLPLFPCPNHCGDTILLIRDNHGMRRICLECKRVWDFDYHFKIPMIYGRWTGPIKGAISHFTGPAKYSEGYRSK